MGGVERVRVQVLGRTRVNGTAVRGTTQARLLCVLAMHSNQDVRSDTLLELCWADSRRPQSIHGLSAPISRLREYGFTDVQLVGSQGTYRLDAHLVDIDAQEFCRLFESAKDALSGGEQDRALRDAQTALALWEGEPYAPLASFTWAEAAIENLTGRYLDLVDMRATLLLRQPGVQISTSGLQAAARLDPFRESTWCLLAHTYYREGNQAKALGVLRDLKELLADELGIDPSPQVADLESRILSQDPSLLGPGDQQRGTRPPTVGPASPVSLPQVGRVPVDWHAFQGRAPRDTPPDIPAGFPESLLTTFEQAEELRLRITETFERSNNIVDAISDLEERVEQHSRVHARIPREHLQDVVSDFAVVERLSSQRQRTSHQIRLCRIAAQLAGIVGIEFHIIGSNRRAADWFQTAYTAASETDDSLLKSWSLVYRSLIPYYNGDWESAIRLLERASHEAGDTPSAITSMALTALGRAHARAGHADLAQQMLHQAEKQYSAIPESARATNVFGFPERRRLFYIGSALTYAGTLKNALEAQDLALSKYDETDTVDTLLISFDKATVLARHGELAEACLLAAQALAEPSNPSGVVLARARGFLRSLSPEQRESVPARQLKDLVTTLQQEQRT